MIDRNSLHLLDSATLHAEMRRLVGLNAESIRDGAVIYEELENRGEDLSYLPESYVRALKLVSSGMVEPEVAIAFQRSPDRMKAVGSLPKSEQVRIATGKPVRVVSVKGGRMVEESIPGTLLTNRQIRSVIRDGRILSPSEQRAAMDPTESTKVEAFRELRIRISESDMAALMRLADAENTTATLYAADLLVAAIRFASPAAEKAS